MCCKTPIIFSSCSRVSLADPWISCQQQRKKKKKKQPALTRFYMSVLIFSLQTHYEEALWDLCTDSCARTTQTHKPNGPAWMKPHCRLRSFWIASYSLRVLAPQFQHFHLEIWQLLPQVQMSIWIHSYLLSLHILFWELCRVALHIGPPQQHH